MRRKSVQFMSNIWDIELKPKKAKANDIVLLSLTNL